jgi:hypothetical protein
MSTVDATSYARANTAPAHYPVNLRVTVPFLPKAFFITLIIGAERRGPERRRTERQRYPLNTWGNLVVALGAWTVFTTATLFAVMVAAGL